MAPARTARGDAAPFHASFDRLFAFGIDPIDGNLPDDRPSDWPAEREVREYLRNVRERLNRVHYPPHLRSVICPSTATHNPTFILKHNDPSNYRP